MKVAIRCIYYMAVTPSMDIIDMPDGMFGKFLRADRLERIEIVCDLLRRKRNDDVKDIAWLPLFGQNKLIEAPRTTKAKYLYYKRSRGLSENPFQNDNNNPDEETKRKSWIWHAECMFDNEFIRNFDEKRVEEIAEWRFHIENVLRDTQKNELAEALEFFPTIQQALVCYSIELHCKWMIYEDYPYWIVEEYVSQLHG